MVLEKVSAKRSWKRHIFPHMEAEKQSDFGKHHSHRWEQKSKVTLEKVTAKEPWKRHGRNAMGCMLVGGVLHYACWWEGPGKVCKEKPWKRHGFILDEIQEQYRSQELSNRLTNLRLSKVVYIYRCKQAMGFQSILGHQSWRSQAPPASSCASLGKALWPKHACEGRRKKNDLCSQELGKAGGSVG